MALADAKLVEARRLLRGGKIAERAGDLKEAKNLYRRGLILDPNASPADWDLLEETPRLFRERRALYSLLAIRVEDMSRACRLESKQDHEVPPSNPLTFVYWGQGFSSAPPIVQACYRQAQQLHASSEIVFLDDSNLHDWVTFPPHVTDISNISRAAFSDVLRFELLAKYGGIWMDATCMPMKRMQDVYPELVAGSGFFAFGKDKPGLISNWFLASEQGNYITRMTRDALKLYWGTYDRPITYFFMHHLFMYLYRLDDRFGSLWDKATVRPDDPRAVNRSMLKEQEEVNLGVLLSGSFVHKLSHKYGPDVASPTSVQQALVDSFAAQLIS
ncbi:hypothetical protein QFZ65_001698 [Arthrobacter sp. B3I9]|uniref:capsular polysaccharide synthesis protein n=1 Tax=Arthrobacter sp. B3I9 TaxID=3042270 RepID=UPI0027926521|nr:capsular polysaccharide synthesis protein [Arthrobacter sp. B3I9]MDQ0849760.1 hypothetical protein [Arthrobacter sp. B3I9]